MASGVSGWSCFKRSGKQGTKFRSSPRQTKAIPHVTLMTPRLTHSVLRVKGTDHSKYGFDLAAEWGI